MENLEMNNSTSGDENQTLRSALARIKWRPENDDGSLLEITTKEVADLIREWQLSRAWR